MSSGLVVVPKTVEVSVVFNRGGEAIYWPENTSPDGGYIEDSRAMWDFVFANINEVDGIAHTHPWYGTPKPSSRDTTTYSAMERGLGKRLLWPIVTLDNYAFFYNLDLSFSDAEYIRIPPDLRYFQEPTAWLKVVEELRSRSLCNFNTGVSY